MVYNRMEPSSQMLKPYKDLEFYKDIHRYKFQGNWMRYSVSRIAQPSTVEQQKRFNETKHIWEPRGNHVHTAAEALLLGLEPEIGSYGEWVSALKDCWLLEKAETMAVELSIVIPRHEVAGTFDALIKTADGLVTLIDFKSVQTDKAIDNRKPATAQLGGYLHGLNSNHLSVNVDKCCTVIVGPGRTKVISEDPQVCYDAWEAKLLDHKNAIQLPF